MKEAKEKANELANKFVFESVFDMNDEQLKESRLKAKQCALIAVDEILEATDKLVGGKVMFKNPKLKYWKEVKKEIDLL